MTQNLNGVFWLIHTISGFCFFNTAWIQDSLFAIVDKLQPRDYLERKIWENHFVDLLTKWRLALICFRVADRWSKILDQSLYDVNRNYNNPWHRSFVDFFLFLDEINLYSCHLPIGCFFILSLLTDANRLKSSICKHNIAFSTSNLHVLMLQKSPPSFLIYICRQHEQ